MLSSSPINLYQLVPIPSLILSQKLLFPFHLEILISVQFLGNKDHTLRPALKRYWKPCCLFTFHLTPRHFLLAFDSSHPGELTACKGPYCPHVVTFVWNPFSLPVPILFFPRAYKNSSGKSSLISQP